MNSRGHFGDRRQVEHHPLDLRPGVGGGNAVRARAAADIEDAPAAGQIDLAAEAPPRAHADAVGRLVIGPRLLDRVARDVGQNPQILDPQMLRQAAPFVPGGFGEQHPVAGIARLALDQEALYIGGVGVAPVLQLQQVHRRAHDGETFRVDGVDIERRGDLVHRACARAHRGEQAQLDRRHQRRRPAIALHDVLQPHAVDTFFGHRISIRTRAILDTD